MCVCVCVYQIYMRESVRLFTPFCISPSLLYHARDTPAELVTDTPRVRSAGSIYR